MAFSFAALDSVRVILGTSAKELPDSTLQDPYFADQLRLALYDLSTTLEDDYVTALAVTPATSASANFLAAFNSFAALEMAYLCLSGLPQFSPKSVTDGKAGFARYSDSPYKETMTRVQAQLEAARRRLLAAQSVLLGGSGELTSAVPTLMAVSSPSTNTVTGI